MDIRKLLEPRAYPHPVTELRLVETHISWVLLTGRYAYKIKKPVDLGFLDFSTLELRRRACFDELRLNRRMAPQLYLDVVPITGSEDAPSVDGAGTAIEYAVKMLQFDPEDQFDRLVGSGRLDPADVAGLGKVLAGFHACAPVATAGSDWGQPAQLRRLVHDNLQVLLAGCSGPVHATLLGLAAWTRMREQELQACMQERLQHGFVREVHGDLHLANLVKLHDGIVAFDCLEFSEALRWLDVVDDLAFATMDLHARGRSDLAYRLLNQYLETSGDYAAVRLLHYYEVFRALVRAKIALIRRDETAGPERAAQAQQLEHYVALAQRRSGGAGAAVVLMHGFAGAGKTGVSDTLMTALPAVRVRSDVERKRLHGLQPREPSRSHVMGGIYSREESERVYAQLAQAAAAIVAGGEKAIVDAAFLQRAQRDRFRELARTLGVPFAIVSCTAPRDELERRIALRARQGTDASEADAAVLEHQFSAADPLSLDELRSTWIVSTTETASVHAALDGLRVELWKDAHRTQVSGAPASASGDAAPSPT